MPVFVEVEGYLNYISETNISEQPLTLHEDVIIGMWLAEDKVPRRPGYVTIGSRRYIEWQNLTHQATTDVISKEEPVEENQAPMVAKPEYRIPYTSSGAK